ncbi:phage terminase small subunit [Pseudoalteromonas phage H105/1]|uniref:terminase small subunit n=1 Tax=Pseudoalteromonas phage H105/1 TaxID=877240 RepID=UPI0001E439D5|nr:terminase small subunit [Pseudoalteromonas phage H105/1]ADM26678.1 phage terminase small subunit [Pseudoalteromonas phage H105/1]
MSKLELTNKQQAFCEEYLIDLNGTQAAIRAGYSEKTANRIASQLLSKLDIQSAIQELKISRSERTQTDYDWVLIEAKKSYELNATVLRDDDGNPKMVNPAAAAKFLELAGKHTKVKAFDSAASNDTGEAQPLEINFNVKPASAEIEITKGGS